MLMSRDVLTVKMLEKGLLLTSDICGEWMYRSPKASETIARRRLGEIVKLGYAKRIRCSVTNRYIYYSGKIPSMNSQHRLMISRTIAKISQITEIVEFELEYSLSEYHVRPDVWLLINYKGYVFQICVEVDLTKKFNSEPYKKLQQDRRHGVYKHLDANSLLVLSVCDTPITDKEVKVLQVKTDFSNINLLKQVLDTAVNRQ